MIELTNRQADSTDTSHGHWPWLQGQIPGSIVAPWSADFSADSLIQGNAELYLIETGEIEPSSGHRVIHASKVTVGPWLGYFDTHPRITHPRLRGEEADRSDDANRLNRRPYEFDAPSLDRLDELKEMARNKADRSRIDKLERAVLFAGWILDLENQPWFSTDGDGDFAAEIVLSNSSDLTIHVSDQNEWTVMVDREGEDLVVMKTSDPDQLTLMFRDVKAL